MKKRVIVLLCAVIALAALCVWQRNNIEALYLYITLEDEEIEKNIEASKAELEEKFIDK